VDLAGSEKLSVHDKKNSKAQKLGYGQKAKKSRSLETRHINKSLFFLTRVISLLST
jgi:centromeric protein E